MAQPSYYTTCNEQPILLSHRYPSPKLDASLPPLSQLLTTDKNKNNNISNSDNNITQIKGDPLVSGEGYYSTQPPSTVLANTDAPLAASVDLFDPITPSVTTTDSTGYVLTSAPLAAVSAAHPLQNTTTLYMEDPTTAATAMMYGPQILPPSTTTTTATETGTTLLSASPSSLSLSSTSSSMNPLLLSTSMAATTHMDTAVPCFYPASAPSAAYTSSSISTAPTTARPRQSSVSSSSSSSDKVYSFVAIPGMDQKKRPRRRYDEIERLYHCTFADCKKSYGTLNHLNSHVLMQNHGPKRHPSEFKEMRKEWRRQRKQREQHKKQVEKENKEQQQRPQPQSQQQSQQPPTLTTAFQPPPFLPTTFSLQPMPLPGFY